MFRKRKKAADYYYGEDEYYAEDNYYDEYYDEDEDEGKSDYTKATNFSGNTHLKQEIETLKREKADLALALTSAQSSSLHFQELTEECATIQIKLDKAYQENQQLTLELEKINELFHAGKEEGRRFQREVNIKQTEIDRLSDQLLNVQAESQLNQTSEQEKLTLKQEILDLRNQLATAKMTSQAIDEEAVISKEDIAEVMLEAKSKARQIIDQANFDSRRIVTDAERDIQIITQDAQGLYQKIYSTKNESEMIFEELLRKLTILSDIESQKE